MERFAPTFLIQIEGEQLSSDITQKISGFVYEDCEDQDDLLEITIAGGLELVDTGGDGICPLCRACHGYVGRA